MFKKIFSLILVVGLLFTGCESKGSSTDVDKENSTNLQKEISTSLQKEISIISDIVYKKNTADCEVYIKENGEYMPYYVISNNYPQKGYHCYLENMC